MLGKNHLGLMHRGTIEDQGGKLAKKPNRKLRPVPHHLTFPAPAKLDDLGCGRGGLRGRGPIGCGEGDGGLIPSLEGGGGQVLGEP